MNVKTAAVVFGFLAPTGIAAVSAADMHPIIEIETGYFFGGSENGKWIKADQAAKSTGKKTIYQVYGLTRQADPITAGKPKSVDEPCPDTLMVPLVETQRWRDRIGRDMECFAKKTDNR